MKDRLTLGPLGSTLKEVIALQSRCIYSEHTDLDIDLAIVKDDRSVAAIKL